MKKEEIIKSYFEAWIKNDNSNLHNIFSCDAQYTECYGPQYHGINQILLWFKEWHEHGKVVKWDIFQFISSGKKTVVEWYFECEYDGKIDGFNGVSIVEFSDELKIKNLKEFESKKDHFYPYDNI